MTLKNLHSIFAVTLLLLLASCSSDDFVNAGGEEEYIGVTASIPALEFEDTRSSLVFSTKGMTFSWEEGDKIRAYPKFYDADKQGFAGPGEAPSVQLTLIPGSVASNDDESVIGQFGTPSGERVILDMPESTDYLTISPDKANTPEAGYTTIPVSYLDQKQASNVKMGYYGKDGNEYMASERAASAHLGAYDYLYGAATRTANGSTHFAFKHLQSTVRFFMRVPDERNLQVFDKIMIFSKHDVTGRHFTTEGTLNLWNTELDSAKFTKRTEADVLTLKLGENGFNLAGDDKEDYFYEAKNCYVIVAYMQIYPVDLLEEHITNPTLYLCGHRGEGNDRVDTYYKAELLKKNLKAGKAYQWSSEVSEDEPITFTEITVQQWEEETGYTNNGADGKTEGSGTNKW